MHLPNAKNRSDKKINRRPTCFYYPSRVCLSESCVILQPCVMTKWFLADNEILDQKIKQTVSAFGLYTLNNKRSIFDHRNRIFIPSKGIILEYSILCAGQRSKLFISASSPISILTASVQDLWTTRFLDDMDHLPKEQPSLAFFSQKTINLFNSIFFPQLRQI